MRIPLLERINLKYALAFAAMLFLVQQIEHTELIFSMLCAGYVILSTLAFNGAGGFTYPSGAFIFFTATLTALVGIVFKAALLEPGQSNLVVPDVTLSAYCGGMLAMGLAAALVRRFVPKRGLLSGMAAGERMKKAAVGSLLLGVTIQVLTLNSVGEQGTILSALRQINAFTILSVLLGTYYQVKVSGGRTSTNWIVWTGGLVIFVTGVVSFSKEGMFTSFVIWFLTAVAAGFEFRRTQFLWIVGFAAIGLMYLVPFSQSGRNFKGESSNVFDDSRTAWTLLLNIQDVRTSFVGSETDVENGYEDTLHFYDRPQGILDRLCMLAPDDALTAYTEDGNEEGLGPTIGAFLNLIPHFIWPDKPFFFVGNRYAHEIGMISSEDETTGISFSPVADAYHQARWWGIFVLLPSILLLLFTLTNALCGPIRNSPWGLLFVLGFAHSAPEGMIGAQVGSAIMGAVVVTLIALIATYVLPVVAGVIMNADRTRVQKGIDFKIGARPGSPGPLR